MTMRGHHLLGVTWNSSLMFYNRQSFLAFIPSLVQLKGLLMWIKYPKLFYMVQDVYQNINILTSVLFRAYLQHLKLEVKYK